MLISFFQCTSGIFRSYFCFRFRSVRNTQFFRSGSRIVSFTENINQDKMCICTTQQCFTLLSVQRSRISHLFDSLQCMVCRSNRHIASVPHCLRRVLIRICLDITPQIGILFLLEFKAIHLTVVSRIVRSLLKHHYRIIVRISRNQQTGNLRLRINFCTIIWHCIKEIATRSESPRHQ